MIDVRVQSSGFEPGEQIERLRTLGSPAVLASLSTVEPAEAVEEIWIEHYPAMARPELVRIAEEADARWPLAGLILVHRHGRLERGEGVLLVAVAASDSAVAVEALAFLQHAVATRAPFWRRETLSDGSRHWVEGRD